MNFNNLPEDLKKLNRWVCWRFEERDVKQTKIPINPKTGGRAMSNNPDTWADFSTALWHSANCKYPGIGFMFNGDGIVGVDLDNVRNPETGELTAEAKEIISTLDSYTEISQSGKGIHIICLGNLPEGARRKDFIEMYQTERYFIMTGNIIDDGHTSIEERTTELHFIHARYLQKEKKEPKKREHNSLEYNLNDDEIIQKASTAKNGNLFNQLMNGDISGYTSQSEAELGLCNFLAFWTKCDAAAMDRIFKRSGLYREKWDDSRAGKSYGEITIQKAIKDCGNTYSPETMQRQNNMNYNQEPPDIDNGLDYLTNSIAYENEPSKTFSLDDVGNAERLLYNFGQNLRYCCTFGKWLIWNGKNWEPDDKGKINQLARETAKRIFMEAYHQKDAEVLKKIAKHASNSCNHTRLKNMILEAKDMENIPVLQSELDADSWLINCENGTIDLKTGKLLEHDSNHLNTKIAPVQFDDKATAPLWESFLQRIFEGNQEIINFLQRAIGYSLTASTKEQCLFIAHGSGANGKSTFINIIQDMVGDYAKNANMNAFLAKQNDSQTNDIARLVGSRFVSAMEADEGKKLSESLIKQLTGEDKMSARFLHKEFFDFTPTFKIWMGTNHKPVIKGTDHGIWRRIMLIPFAVTIPLEERDKDLTQKLKKEISGILNWAIEGCLLWQKNGLKPPSIVQAANDNYRAEMDLIKTFLNECCKKKEGNFLSSSSLYKVYSKWCDSNGEYAKTQRDFSLKLKEKGLKPHKSMGLMYWLDIELSDMGNKVNYGVAADIKNNQVKM